MAYISRQTSSMNPYSAGNKIYGGGRSFPTSGPVDKMGYAERDRVSAARRSAIVRRLKANSKGDYASADSLRRV